MKKTVKKQEDRKRKVDNIRSLIKLMGSLGDLERAVISFPTELQGSWVIYPLSPPSSIAKGSSGACSLAFSVSKARNQITESWGVCSSSLSLGCVLLSIERYS